MHMFQQFITLAKEAAQQASDYINQVDRSALKVLHKEAGSSAASQVVTEVDKTCEDMILAVFADFIQQYDLAVLAEESASSSCGHPSISPEVVDTHKLEDTHQETGGKVVDTQQSQATFYPRLRKDYFICIDPLDGTLPFVQNRTGFAVAIALVDRSGICQAAVVQRPDTQQCFSAIRGEGVLLNDKPFVIAVNAVSSRKANALFIYDGSFTKDAAFAVWQQRMQTECEQLGLKFCVQDNCGAVVNALTVLQSDCQLACYFKPPKEQEGGGSIWDFAATSLLLQEAGMQASNFAGGLIDLNRPDSNFMNHQGIMMANRPFSFT